MHRTESDEQCPNAAGRATETPGTSTPGNPWSGFHQIICLIGFCVLSWLAVIGAIFLFY